MNTPNHTPPRWIRKFLSSFLHARLLEASLGDLEEKFNHRLKSGVSPFKTKMLYILEALGFIRLAQIEKDASAQATLNTINHTFLFFTRLVRKDKSYYLVSLLGLTVSLSSFLFIAMFIHDELAYDAFHVNGNRVCRVATHIRLNDVLYDQATSYFPLAHALKTELPEVEEAVRVFKQDFELQIEEKKFEERVILVDSNFFSVFTFTVLIGDVRSALSSPASIILAETTAKKYFGTDNAIGRTVVVYDQPLTVTAIVKDTPTQSHIKFGAIIPLEWQLEQWKKISGNEGRENKWFWTGTYTYVMLNDEKSKDKVQAKLPLIVNKYFPERYKAGGSLELQPLRDIHLKSNLASEFEPGGSILYVRFFLVVAIVIMLVSSINLINLSYFKISSRVSELGIRKFLGQNAARIVMQLSIESVLVGVIAFVGALLLSMASISRFNLLVQKNLILWSKPNVLILAGTFVLIVFICMVAVIRPAIRYASRPSNYLLLKSYRSPGQAHMRNVLIGLQVGFSFVLLVFSFIISNQLTFFKNKDLGFDRANVIVVTLNDDLWNKVEAFKTELKKNKDVILAAGGTVPGTGHNGWRFIPEGGSYEKPFMFPLANVDADFLPTLNIKLLAGRNFTHTENYDSIWPFIINKRAAVELGWQGDPINRILEIFAAGTTEIMGKGRVIGLVDDYHFESLHKPVKPLVLSANPYFDKVLVKISETSAKEGTASIETTWKKFSDKPFQYETLGSTLDKLYTKEDHLSNVILFFTIIALYLTSYGMFAMSSLLFSSRLKEVAIRKVFGATQSMIIKQFYSRYALFNVFAIIAGFPIALYVGNLWLQTFQYRIEMSASLFIKAAVCILAAGLLSVTYYLIRVAVSNPVKFLRRD